MINSIILVQLFSLYLLYANGWPSCQSLHARSRGINLACCGGAKHEQLAHSCRFKNSLCADRSRGCRCIIEVNVPTLECILFNKTQDYHDANSTSDLWKDHDEQLVDPFVCSQPNLPNPHANFAIDIRFSEWNSEKLAVLDNFRLGLTKYRITSMELYAGPSVPKIQAHFFSSFPNLHKLTIHGPGSDPVGAGPMHLSVQSLMQLANLQSLTVKNLHFVTSGGVFQLQMASNFTPVIRRLHLESLSQFHRLPLWLAQTRQLRYVRFKRTKIKDLGSISKLEAIEYLYAPQNEIEDLRTIEFDVPSLLELDVSDNLIHSISARTFRKAPALRFLDLSGNPLRVLPNRVFSKLTSLQWLHLKRTRLVHLSAAHVTGLVSLTELSLQGNSHLQLDTFSMLPLTALETLDLRDCNLTRLPDAVSQACDLKHLWLNFNQVRELTPEVVLHLNRLDQLVLSENPVFSNPVSLLLLPPRNIKLLSSVLVSLKQLPAWWADPCTPFMWWLHLVNGTMTPPAATKIYSNIFPSVPYFESRDGKRCTRRYYRISSEMTQLYQPLLEKTRCETVRRLRSIDLTPPSPHPPKTHLRAVILPTVAPQPLEWQKDNVILIMISSLLINMIFVLVCVPFCILKCITKQSR